MPEFLVRGILTVCVLGTNSIFSSFGKLFDLLIKNYECNTYLVVYLGFSGATLCIL